MTPTHTFAIFASPPLIIIIIATTNGIEYNFKFHKTFNANDCNDCDGVPFCLLPLIYDSNPIYLHYYFCFSSMIQCFRLTDPPY